MRVNDTNTSIKVKPCSKDNRNFKKESNSYSPSLTTKRNPLRMINLHAAKKQDFFLLRYVGYYKRLWLQCQQTFHSLPQN